ncbi:MAG: alpha/beta hydrolase, partial [Planctomycetaceae bacterium]|nr:alpha/beta hydrolase [Planctomycetaceae bacterium]
MRFCLTIACCLLATTVWAQPPKRVVPEMPAPQVLWAEGAPGAIGMEDTDKPALWVFLPPAEKAVGSAVVICPGGGYGGLAVGHEGKEIADWYNGHGVAAFVLRYRLAPRYKHPAPLEDVQRAIRTVRSRAEDYKIDPARIGVMGFSAGGHLASTAGTHFDEGKADATDPIDRVSCRPDFMVLGYPVIALGSEYAHQGSKKNLLGAEPDPKLVELLSNEKQIKPNTPPTFLFHTNEDTGVPPENSILFYLGLRKAKIPAEL